MLRAQIRLFQKTGALKAVGIGVGVGVGRDWLMECVDDAHSATAGDACRDSACSAGQLIGHATELYCTFVH